MKLVIRVTIGIAIGVVLLYFAASGVDLDAIESTLARARFQPMLVALAVYWLAILLRTFRWRLLLSATRHLSVTQTGRALLVGYALNNILPARLGELLRVDYVRRQFGVARSAALGSVILERLQDGIAAVSLLVVGLTIGTFESDHMALVSGTVIAAVGISLIAAAIFVIGRTHERLLGQRFPWLSERLAILIVAMTGLDRESVLLSLSMTVAIWLADSLAILFLMLGFGVHVSPVGLALVVGAAAISTIIPSAPGYVGSLQAAYVLTFTALGLDLAAGLLSATASQVLLLGSVTLVGLLILLHDHLKGVYTSLTSDTKSHSRS